MACRAFDTSGGRDRPSQRAVRNIRSRRRLFVWIVLLHLIRVGLWAVVFWQARELPTLETAVYFSLATYTTIGFGDVVLGPGWRVLAGIEGLTGIPLVSW